VVVSAGFVVIYNMLRRYNHIVSLTDVLTISLNIFALSSFYQSAGRWPALRTPLWPYLLLPAMETRLCRASQPPAPF
jgi:hypothetical protein